MMHGKYNYFKYCVDKYSFVNFSIMVSFDKHI